MLTLGINAAFHDPAACLVRDGTVIAAAEEERFTKIKHGKRPVPFSTWELPFHAIDYCLREGHATLGDVDHVAYSFDPTQLLGHRIVDPTIEIPLDLSVYEHTGEWLSPWDPLFLSYVSSAPGQLADGAPHHLAKRFGGGAYEWRYVEHHLAHEASGFLAAPFEECAVLALDGRGESATTSYGVFAGGDYRRIGQIDLPHSLGLLYEEVTAYLGFLHSSDEYKVMALAAYGVPTHLRELRDLVRLEPDGGFTVEPIDWSAFVKRRQMGDEEWTSEHADLACSVQRRLEEMVLGLAGWLYEQTADDVLTLAGGVALNCVANARLADEGIGPERHRYEVAIDMRHHGQINEVEVAVEDARLGADREQDLRRRFVARYEQLYGRGSALAGARLEIVTVRLRARATTARPQLAPAPLADAMPAANARRPARDIWWPEANALVPTPVYDGEQLEPGNALAGPAIVETRDTTVVVHPQMRLEVDALGNFCLDFPAAT